ncbi:hypothetical protein D1AOALGA4SA_6965 [Olavius algarvensis Delta 1 endosymbiont]|nr:hypothetical protein D1AOALGA4SA_6965 [Olavius algarvensis Delta 1 endosymbiont]
MLIYDQVYSWEGFGGVLRLASGKCRLQIFDLEKEDRTGLAHLRPMIIIASDVADSRMSVRSCCGHIATGVARDFNIKPDRMMFIEYYPRTVYGEQQDHVIAEKYDVVDFKWHEDKAILPKWRALKPPMLDTVKSLMESTKVYD